jgi:hypothetical protein
LTGSGSLKRDVGGPPIGANGHHVAKALASRNRARPGACPKMASIKKSEDQETAQHQGAEQVRK